MHEYIRTRIHNIVTERSSPMHFALKSNLLDSFSAHNLISWYARRRYLTNDNDKAAFDATTCNLEKLCHPRQQAVAHNQIS